MATKLYEELEILYAAMATVRGIVIQTEDVKRALPRFYNARKEAEDESLMVLSFRRSPFSKDEFMIVKAELPRHIPKANVPPSNSEPSP